MYSPAKRFASSAQGEFGSYRNYTYTIRDNSLTVLDVKSELKGPTEFDFQKLLALHHRTSRHEIL